MDVSIYVDYLDLLSLISHIDDKENHDADEELDNISMDIPMDPHPPVLILTDVTLIMEIMMVTTLTTILIEMVPLIKKRQISDEDLNRTFQEDMEVEQKMSMLTLLISKRVLPLKYCTIAHHIRSSSALF